MDRIILASASPRRKQLLEWAEVPFDLMPSDIEELTPDGMPAHEIPLFLACQKATAVRELAGNDRIILAADTIVVMNNQVLGKPRDRSDALRMLALLSGRKHQVITGVSIIGPGKMASFSEMTTVSFHHISKSEIEHYIDNYKPFDKAGAYAIQEWIGVIGIQSIEGDFYNVMGLPVSRVVKELKLFSDSPPEKS